MVLLQPWLLLLIMSLSYGEAKKIITNLNDIKIHDFSKIAKYKECNYSDVLAGLFRPQDEMLKIMEGQMEVEFANVTKAYSWGKIKRPKTDTGKNGNGNDRERKQRDTIKSATRSLFENVRKLQALGQAFLASKEGIRGAFKVKRRSTSKREQLIDYIMRRFRRDSCNCDTDWYGFSPVEVSYGGITYDVYQPPEGYQVYFEGRCGCTNGHQCVVYSYNFIWILIVDSALPTTPNIRFVPVQYNSHCYSTS